MAPESVTENELSSTFRSWKKISKKDLNEMEKVGEVEVPGEPNMETYTAEHGFEHPDYPIAFLFYPYDGCDLYRDHDQNLYLVYREFGGHVPELRCRLYRPELVV